MRGKREVERVYAVTGLAHPRRCGENLKDALNAVPHGGSSPQVRGKPADKWLRVSLSRLIPAGAGKTHRNSNATYGNAAHPRRCGENDGTAASTDAPCGSSPQVRGKLLICTESSFFFRLIPAGAGKTDTFTSSSLAVAAHPRRCGENAYSPFSWSTRHGSSPQVRGKHGLILLLRV